MGRKRANRHLEAYEVICDFVRERGYGPTMVELCERMRLKSTNSAAVYVRMLQEQDLVTRDSPRGPLRLVQGSAFELQHAGQVVAGAPREAVECIETLDFSDIFASTDHFCLEVVGDSMIDDHITAGDLAVIRRQSTAHNGQIVAALVDGEEATLKRFYREADCVRLQPANESMEPIYVRDVRILGVLIAIIRRT